MGIEAAQRAYDRQMPEEDPAFERDLQDFADDVDAMVDKFNFDTTSDALREIWAIWRKKKSRAVDGNVLIDANTFDALSQQFTMLESLAIELFEQSYDHDLA